VELKLFGQIRHRSEMNRELSGKRSGAVSSLVHSQDFATSQASFAMLLLACDTRFLCCNYYNPLESYATGVLQTI